MDVPALLTSRATAGAAYAAAAAAYIAAYVELQAHDHALTGATGNNDYLKMGPLQQPTQHNVYLTSYLTATVGDQVKVRTAQLLAA